MDNVPMVDLKGQYKHIKKEIQEALDAVLEHNMYINGPEVKSFAQSLKQYLNCEDVIPCANGTDALQIALMALDLKPGDEVITTPFTFVATAEVIALLQLKPVFVDVHPDTFNINETLLESVITEKTKCIIPVHLFGQCAHMEPIMEIAEKNGLYVVEDSAQAIGSDYTFSDGRTMKAGTIGHIGTTSFFPSKNLGCYGDGGALYTNDADLANKIRQICNHGSERRYFHDEIGVNSRLDSMQAAVLNVKLQYLDDYNRARQEAAQRYEKLLGDLAAIETPVESDFSTHIYHQYTLRLRENRDEAMEYLSENGISSAIYYPVPLHLQNAYRHYGYQEGDMPVSESLATQVLSLPIHTELESDTQEYIAQSLKDAIGAPSTKNANS